MYVRSSEDAKCYFSEISPKNQVYFPLISKGQKHEMSLKNTLSTYQYSLESRLLLVSSGPNNHHLKSMHFSAKTAIFCIFRHRLVKAVAENIECQMGKLSAVCPKEIFIVMQ